MELTDSAFAHNISFESNSDIYCCVCFNDYTYLINNDITTITNNTIKALSLNDIETTFFPNNIIPDELLISSTCNLHYLCISCIRKIINNYENHPINENNSHFYCPYPFGSCETSIGFKNIFDHNLIKKICRNDIEWQNYINYANQYAFPGFTIIYCPFRCIATRDTCNSLILVETDVLKNTPIGEMIIECTQNIQCLKKFCYYCKSSISIYSSICYDCKLCYENENPNTYNYYINKIYSLSHINSHDSYQYTTTSELLQFNESDYLYKNSELTSDIIISQINSIIENIHSYMICPICKISIYKTEKCNGLSHHGIERCYACGRIGFKIKGLGEHWNATGIEGCFRFDYESFVKKNIPEYLCQDTFCHNHDKGDCSIDSHQDGIIKLANTRKIAYIYHLLKSIPSQLRNQVYDIIYDTYSNIPSFMDLIPYKQTFILIDKFKKRCRDYTENIVYNQLNCIHPKDLPEFISKFYTIDADSYISTFSIQSNSITNQDSIQTNFVLDPNESAWRRYIVNPQIRHNNLQHEYDFTNVTTPLLNYLNSRLDTIDNIDTLDITEARQSSTTLTTTPLSPITQNNTTDNLDITLNEDDIINIYTRYYSSISLLNENDITNDDNTTNDDNISTINNTSNTSTYELLPEYYLSDSSDIDL